MDDFLSRSGEIYKNEDALENLTFWVRSILLHASSGEKESGSSDSHAPVVLVGTHYDKIKKLSGDIASRKVEIMNSINELILKELRGLGIAFGDNTKDVAVGGAFLANSDENLCYWPIDNSDSDDKNVRKLRVHLRQIVLIAS